MRILFTVHPGAGHLHPMAPLARELGRRGHDVRVAASPALADAVSAAGLVHLPAGMLWLESDADAHLPGFTDADPVEGLAVLSGEPSVQLAADVLTAAADWSLLPRCRRRSPPCRPVGETAEAVERLVGTREPQPL